MGRERRVSRGLTSGSGFTLIELLVVVAIIALLISILLPSLARARQQGKQVACLANLKTIGLAMQQYFLEEKDWFPMAKSSYQPMHGFYYGGHPGRQKPSDPSNWWGYVMPEARDTPGGRPFNRYNYPDMPKYDVPKEDPQFEVVRKMPIYQCPSDTGGFWSNEKEDNQMSYQLYWETGSSFDLNYGVATAWAMPKDEGGHVVWQERANAFWRVQQRKYGATFIAIYEDPFDPAVWCNVPKRGWHQEMNRHNFLFLDGHAANIVADTTIDAEKGRKGHSGLGWKTCTANAQWKWFEDMNDPDYPYRDLTP